MKKKIIITAVVLLLAGLLSVFCYIIFAPTMKHNADGNLTYNERLYIYEEDTTGFWHCDVLCDNMSEIGWCWYLIPLAEKTQFYVDNKENPDYICGVNQVYDIYFREDYDYIKDIFVIHGHPLVSIRFSDSYNENNFIETDAYHSAIANFDWSPEGHPNLWNSPEIYLIENKYYIQFVWDQPYYEVSEAFLSILIDAGIVTAE